jgi:hypothetical protein
LPSQVRGQRISHPELIEEAYSHMVEGGYDNYLRAKFISRLAQLVVKDDSAILFQQRADIRVPSSEAWAGAFELVYSYLVEVNLPDTAQTAKAEYPESERFAKIASGQHSSEHFEALVQLSDSPPPKARKKTRKGGRKSPKGRKRQAAEAEPKEPPQHAADEV